MELVPAVTAWLSSKQRLLKRNVQDAVSNPADFVDKQLTNFNEDMKPEQVFDLEVWKRELLGQGKGLVEGEAATAVLGKAFGPAGMAAAQAASVLTPMLVGAFRPVGSKLLPSTLQSIKKGLAPDPREKIFASLRDPDLELAKSIEGKISDRALQNYGTEKFPLDPYLGHVRGGQLTPANKMLEAVGPRELSLMLLRVRAQDTVVGMRNINSSRASELTRSRLPGVDRSLEKSLADLDKAEQALRSDLDAMRDSIRYKSPLVEVSSGGASYDIQDGAYNLGKILGDSPYSDEQLSKKSLEQLVSIGKKTEAAQLKEASVIKDFTVKRSAQLNQEQGLTKGFIELKTQQDLGAETEFMNNCVGAGGAHPRTGKFIPKWHPITGEQITKGFAEDSGDQYWKRLQSGNERIFSYRPEGLPVATIRMDTRTGEVIEALGVENMSIPASMAKEIKLFTDQKKGEFLGFPLAYKYKRIALDDPFAHNVPRAIDQLIRPNGAGFVQRAEWNRQDNLRRIQQIQNDFRQFEAGDLNPPPVQVAAWEAEQAALRAARELNPPPAQIEWEPDGGLFGDF